MKMIAALIALSALAVPAFGQCADGKCGIQRSQAMGYTYAPVQAPQVVATAPVAIRPALGLPKQAAAAYAAPATAVRAERPKLFGRLFRGLGCCGK